LFRANAPKPMTPIHAARHTGHLGSRMANTPPATARPLCHGDAGGNNRHDPHR
jgi:hypothetical protein